MPKKIKNLTEEWKKNISLSNKKNPLRMGKHSSPNTEFKKGLIPWNKGLKGIHLNPSTEFKKNQIPWIKGKHHSKESKEKMSLAKIGRHHSNEHKKKISLNHRHYQLEETKRKIGLANKGKVSWRKGKKLTINHKQKISLARSKQILPIKDTSIEMKIQDFLKQLGIDFFTHQYIKDIEHGYQCDILIPSMNMIIECDGNYWHKYPIGRDIDKVRTSELMTKGFKILRLWESEINDMDLEQFKSIIGEKV